MPKHSYYDYQQPDHQEGDHQEGDHQEGEQDHYKSYSNYMRVSEHKRAQLLHILQHSAHLSNAQIAKLTHLSRTKIAQIRREYDLTADVRVTQGANHKSPEKQQMEQRQKEAILAIIADNPRCGLKDIIDQLASHYGLHLRRSSVHKRLTRDLGYAYQPLSPPLPPLPTLNDDHTIFARGLFCASLRTTPLRALFVTAVAVFSPASQDCAWMPRQSLPRPAACAERTDSVQLLVTLSIGGIVQFDILEAGLSVQTLTDHLRRGLCSRPKLDGQKLLVAGELLADVAEGQEVKKEGSAEAIFEGLNIELVILPPHSPKISPAYWFFQVAQRKFRAYRTLKKNVKCKESVKAGVEEVMRLMGENDSYFRRVAEYLTVRSPNDVKLSFFIEK